jgi:PEP-CTERM/exosortase A-associated glycosyltransferase
MPGGFGDRRLTDCRTIAYIRVCRWIKPGCALMRILHILDHSLPAQTGYVYRTLGIVNQQRALGWQPVMLTSGKHYASGSGRAREVIDGWEFLRTQRPSGLSGRLPWIAEVRIIRDLGGRLAEIVAEVSPDILHAHSPVLNVIPALRLGRGRGIPVVYEVRAFWEDARVGNGAMSRGGLRYLATRGLETRALRRADAVVTICEGLCADVVARGIPRDKVTVVPNAVDRAAFPGAGEPDPDLALRLGLAGKTVLGFFGSFYRYEGLHLLLGALPELRRRRPDLAILLVGGGPEEGNLHALARELNLAGSVVFAGRVPHAEIRRYYDLADLLVFPRLSSRLTDLVTPLKPLEAMAQQRIVLASDVGGHRELIRDRQTGYLFRPNEPRFIAAGVAAALDDRASWPRIRAQASRYIDSERSWAHCALRYAEVYARVLRRPAAQPSHRWH